MVSLHSQVTVYGSFDQNLRFFQESLFFNKKPVPDEEPVELTNKQIYLCAITNIVMGLVGIAFIILLRGQ